jgi:predicted MPP superfamily phosphohydrolase
VIEQTEHVVRLPNLPEALRGLRVVQLSDLHRSAMTPDPILHHAVALANAACPDLIVLTGDFVSADPKDIEPCGHIMAPLHAPLGRYCVLGNHDYSTDGHRVERMLNRLGAEVLTNRAVKVKESLWIVGLDDDRYGHPDVHKAFRGGEENEPTIVRSHSPVGAELVSHRDCLVLSGHTHGGQVRLPILTAREVRRIGAKHYRAGWFKVGRAQLYVNRGLGRVGLPVRFLCRPEISIFTLQPA